MAATAKFPAATKHTGIQELFPNVFVVQGTAHMGPMVIGRCMTIVRHEGELTLISAVRLNDEGLAALEALGEVKHVFKLGAFHGMDDAFYVDKYGAQMWCLKGHKLKNDLTADHVLDDGDDLPFPNAELHIMKHIKVQEGFLLLKQNGGILIAVDALHNIKDDPLANFGGRTFMKIAKFNRPMNPGVGFVSACCQPADYSGPTLLESYSEIAALNFSNFISGHGQPVTDGSAKSGLLRRLEQLGPDYLSMKADPMKDTFANVKSYVIMFVIFVCLAAFAGYLYTQAE